MGVGAGDFVNLANTSVSCTDVARLRAKGVEVTFAPCAPLTNAILIDASKDGGAWWFPQPDGNFDASEPHQGKALADFLRSQGNEVVEVGRGVEITNELLGSFNKVIRAGVFGAYTGSELAAYDQYILRSDAHLLLTTALLSGGAVDPISESIGLPMEGSHTGVMSPVGATAITQGVGPLPYSPPGAVVGPAPTAAITPLGILGNGSVVMGLVTSEPAQILFIGNLLLLEGVPQPLVSNLLSWLFSAPGGEGPLAPVIQSVSVFDQTTGAFGSATTLEVSSADAVLTTRVAITAGATGVQFIQIDYRSPSGKQLRRPCWPFGTLISGSDTNGDGEWECTNLWPRYSEAGLWQPTLVAVQDPLGNFTSFSSGADGLCDVSDPTNCFTGMPQITVISDPTDISPPVLLSLDVGLDVQPRSFGSSITVDAGAQAHPIVFRFHATDDLSGVESPHERFIVVLGGPSGQRQQQRSCFLTEGTPLDGFWECAFTISQFAEAGTWGLTRLFVPDRVGNDGIQESASFYTPNGSGSLCQPDADCVAAPTVEVTGVGDDEPPVLGSLGLNVVGPTVTITLEATDNLSGTNEVIVQFDHPETFQSELCFASLTAGTSNDGTWQCSITFSEFAAQGDWVLSFLTLVDASSNRRLHRGNVDEDGVLCYSTPAGDVCEDFGNTVINLP